MDSEDTAFADFSAEADIAAGKQLSKPFGLKSILVCRDIDGQLYALVDNCPHANQIISGGRVVHARIMCPKHGACFDLKSGKPVNKITPRSIKILPVRVRDGRIEVDLAPLNKR